MRATEVPQDMPQDMSDDMEDMVMMEMGPIIVSRNQQDELEIKYPGVFVARNDLGGSVANFDITGELSDSWPDAESGTLTWKGVIAGAHLDGSDFRADMTVILDPDAPKINDNATMHLEAANFTSEQFGPDKVVDWTAQHDGAGGFYWSKGECVEKQCGNHNLNGFFFGDNHEGVAGDVRDWDRDIEAAIFGAARDLE